MLPTSLQGEEESFQASFLLVFVLSRRRLFMFSQRRVQPKTRPHLLWKWRCYNEVGGRRGSVLLLVRFTEPFCIFSPHNSRHRLSSYLRVEFHLLQFFILSLSLFLALSFLTFCENVRFLLFVRASSKLLSEWLRRLVTRLTHVHSFPPSMSQFLENLDGYRLLLIFTIRGAILPSFHPTVIKWAFLIVSDTKDRILEIFLFLSSDE